MYEQCEHELYLSTIYLKVFSLKVFFLITVI